MEEKLVELLKDEAFVKEFVAQATAEDAQKLLASKGVEISLEEVEKIGKIMASASETSEEMDDSALEQVAGGAITNQFIIDIINDIIKRKPIKPVGPGGIAPWWRLKL
jgi:hypothetical protein